MLFNVCLLACVPVCRVLLLPSVYRLWLVSDYSCLPVTLTLACPLFTRVCLLPRPRLTHHYPLCSEWLLPLSRRSVTWGTPGAATWIQLQRSPSSPLEALVKTCWILDSAPWGILGSRPCPSAAVCHWVHYLAVYPCLLQGASVTWPQVT